MFIRAGALLGLIWYIVFQSTLGFRKNIETLQRITTELQNQENRPAQVKTLGRCAALYHGEWYR